MFQVKSWSRVFYRVGLGGVLGRDGADPAASSYDFSFEIKRLAYPEAAAFRAAYRLAMDEAPFARLEALQESLLQLRVEDEMRRADAMKRAREEGKQADPRDLVPSRALMEAFGEIIKTRVDVSSAFCAALPDGWLKQTFTDYTRDVQGLEIDGQQQTTGAALYEVADEDLSTFVLRMISERANLSVAEGKASSSPSTSQQGDVTPAGV